MPDSAVWIDHLRRPIPEFNQLLATDRVFGHAFVTGEVSLGSLAGRARVITRLHELPQTRVATLDHLTMLIEAEKLYATGVGYIDVHLLASVRLSPGTRLWTRDKRLRAQAERLGLVANLD